METIKNMLEGAKEKITGGRPDPEIRREVLEDYQRAWATAGDTLPGGGGCHRCHGHGRSK